MFVGIVMWTNCLKIITFFLKKKPQEEVYKTAGRGFTKPQEEVYKTAGRGLQNRRTRFTKPQDEVYKTAGRGFKNRRKRF